VIVVRRRVIVVRRRVSDVHRRVIAARPGTGKHRSRVTVLPNATIATNVPQNARFPAVSVLSGTLALSVIRAPTPGHTQIATPVPARTAGIRAVLPTVTVPTPAIAEVQVVARVEAPRPVAIVRAVSPELNGRATPRFVTRLAAVMVGPVPVGTGRIALRVAGPVRIEPDMPGVLHVMARRGPLSRPREPRSPERPCPRSHLGWTVRCSTPRSGLIYAVWRLTPQTPSPSNS
jgi:hypothetical protein